MINLLDISVVQLRVVTEEEERSRIVAMCHEGCDDSTQGKAIGGHIGRDKTLTKVLER